MVTVIADRIVVDASIRSGKPVIQGTRVPVDLVISKLAAGMSEGEICTEYEITPQDIRAVLAYAATILSGEEVRAYA